MRVCAALWELIGHHDRKPQKNSGKKMLPVKKFQEIISSSKKIRKIFFACEKFPGNIFFGKIRTRTYLQNRIIPKLPQKPSKTQFSDVIAIAGSQGHLQPVSPEKPAIINAKKRCP
jgi:hypothetical protein